MIQAMMGTTLGRYRLLEPLAKGVMGEVFLAEDPVLGRKVAIKVLPREFVWPLPSSSK